MKKIIATLMILSIVLITTTGCAKEITEIEANNLAKEYIISEFGNPDVPIVISKTFLENNEWHVQVSIDDDKGTVILDKKGNVKNFESYKWV